MEEDDDSEAESYKKPAYERQNAGVWDENGNRIPSPMDSLDDSDYWMGSEDGISLAEPD